MDITQTYKPHEYQRYAQRAVVDMPAVGLYLEMGLGKTVITLSAIQELKYDRFTVNKVLIIAPKKVAEGTWQAEARKWAHLQTLRLSTVLGTEAQRLQALRSPADVYIINRENVPWLVKLYGAKWPFDMVVLDESTSFKNPQAKRFRALKAVRPRISRIVELTGTPSPHGLLDLWSQLYLLDGGARLGRTLSVYRDAFFVPDKRNRNRIFSYVPAEGAEEYIRKAISDICISMKSEDYLALPDLVYDDIPVVLDTAAQEAYRSLEASAVLQTVHDAFLDAVEASDAPCAVFYHMDTDVPNIVDALCGAGYGVTSNFRAWLNLPDDDRLRTVLLVPPGAYPENAIPDTTIIQYDDVITATSAAALSGKLLQLCSGAVYDEEHAVHEVHSCKLDALTETVEQLNGEHALICYYFRHDLDRIQRALQGCGRVVRVYHGPQDEDDWNAGKIDLLLIQPGSCGYGLNLQHGGHHIIWFTPTWNLEEYQQTNKRLHRQGQDHPVIVHRLVVQGGRDEDVLASLECKGSAQDALMDSLKAIVSRVKEEQI